MSGMTGGDITTLTGNAGGLIPSSGSGNFNIVGSGTITVTGAPATHTLTISGGGVSGMTQHALAVGTAGGSITSLTLGTNGTVLTGVTGADPAFSASPTLTSVLATTFDTNVAAAAVTLAGTTLSADGTDADININITAKGTGKVIIDDLQLTTDLAVTEGGTGVSTLLDHGLLVGSGTAAIDSIGVGANGTVLVGNTTADPSFSANPTVSTIYATTFDTNVAAAGVTLAGTTLAADGTDANIGLTLTPKGTGDVTVTLGDVVLSSGNLNIPNSTSTVGQIQQNGIQVLHNFGGVGNFFLGYSGNFTMTAASSGNTAVGNSALLNLSGTAGLAGAGNCAFGLSSQQQLTNGGRNSSYGCLSAMSLLTGGYSCFYGYGTGTNYTTSESSNILIGYDVNGTVGESNKLRIGKATGAGAGELNAAYIAGIYNTAVGATAGVVLADSSNQLGGLAGSSGQVLQGGTKPAFSTTTYPSTTAKGDVLVASANNVVGVVNDVVNAGYVLTTNVGAAPSFQALPAAPILSVSGTANQVTASTVAGAVTLSTPATFIAPGTIAATTTVTAGTNLISTAGNLMLPTTSSTVGQIKINNNTVFHTYGGESGNDIFSNLFLGKNAGNFTNSTAVNQGGDIGIGGLALANSINCSENFALGYKALYSLIPDGGNSGYRNIAIGRYAGQALLGNSGVNYGGSYNLLIGYLAGYYLNASEYNNIYLNHSGTAGECATLRIGDGTQTTAAACLGTRNLYRAYISGIYGITPGGTQNICLIDSNNQLGSVATLPPSLGGAMTWTEVTGTSQAAAVNNGYITNNVALVTVTLPSTAAVGQRVAITGKGAGLWTLAQNAGQTVHFGSFDTTTGTGGSITASVRYDCIEVQCITANTDWVVIRSVGALVIV